MKFSSIGSPFLSYIQTLNHSQFTPAGSTLTMTHMEMLALKEFAPRVLRDHTKHALVLKVMVDIYHSRETWAGFLGKTTCLMQLGTKRLQNVIEYCWLEHYQLSMPEKLGLQLVSQTHHRREYLASTSPQTLRQVQNHRREVSFAGLDQDQFQE
ncbi:hypothetical protein C8R27_1529 [Nitrosomonas ureae]|nr:hypothetical protein C8R27_1529 [Nitrosomonas ureae]